VTWDKKAPFYLGKPMRDTHFHGPSEWRDATKPIKLSLCFYGFEGRMGVLKDEEGDYFYMFLQDLGAVIGRGAFGVNGTLKGEFTIRKQGQKYGLVMEKW